VTAPDPELGNSDLPRGAIALEGRPAFGPEAGHLKVDVVDSEAGFDDLRDQWNGLVSRLELPSPFQSWEWHRSWWRHFADPKLDRLRLVLFRRETELIGIAPLKERRRLGLTDLSPLGYRDRITEHRVLLFPPADRARLMEALWSWLLEQRWSSVGIPQLGEHDPLPGAMASHVVGSETVVFEHLALPKTWEALDRALNQSMRSNVRYYPKLMVREGHPYSFEVARTAEQVTSALPILWALHAARAAARTNIRHLDYMKPPRRRAFWLEVIPRLAARGEAAVGMLRVHGEVVAAQMWLEKDGFLFAYYSGFDPAWSKYSVAMITTSEIFKDAMSRGVTRVEFLRGANHFKSRWGTDARLETEYVLARRRRLIGARESYFRQNRSLRLKIGRWRARLERLHLPIRRLVKTTH
jgi:CelD/BcsL family acetyltransferase involved in cellulose biosynthesis